MDSYWKRYKTKSHILGAHIYLQQIHTLFPILSIKYELIHISNHTLKLKLVYVMQQACFICMLLLGLEEPWWKYMLVWNLHDEFALLQKTFNNQNARDQV